MRPDPRDPAASRLRCLHKARHANRWPLLLAPRLAATPNLAPAAPPLYTPFPCEARYPVTQGHNTGSHTGSGAWAWDFGIPVGGEVSAPADGVIRAIRMDSTLGGCNASFANDGNYVVIAFDDGTEVLLLHLEAGSSTLAVGDPVQQGDLVGRVDLTGWVCGAHLHVQLQQTCPSWFCESIPGAFIDYGDPPLGTDVASNNCPQAIPCEATFDGANPLVIDDSGPCFEQQSSWWWDGAGGIEGAHVYTWTIEGEADTVGTWRFDVAQTGEAVLEVHIPQTQAASEQAIYIVDTGREVVRLGPIDQSRQKGWVELGTLTFTAGEGRRVSLTDNTQEARALERELAFDAIRLQPIELSTGTSGDDGSTGLPNERSSSSSDTLNATTTASEESTSSSTGEPLPGSGATQSESGSSDGFVLPGLDDEDHAAGCACSSGGQASPRLGAVLLLLLLGLPGSWRRRLAGQSKWGCNAGRMRSV